LIINLRKNPEFVLIIHDLVLEVISDSAIQDKTTAILKTSVQDVTDDEDIRNKIKETLLNITSDSDFQSEMGNHTWRVFIESFKPGFLKKVKNKNDNIKIQT